MRPWRAAIGVALLFAIPRCSCSQSSSEADCVATTRPHESYVVEQGYCGGWTCAARCDPGFVDCDNDATNGCETPTTAAGPHEELTGPNPSDYTQSGCGGQSYSDQIVGSVLQCQVRCELGWSDCDHVASNGCETPSETCTPDASPFKDVTVPPNGLLATLTHEPLGLAACAKTVFYLDGNELHAIDEITLVDALVTITPSLPAGGLACDGEHVYWTTLADTDASTPNGTLMRSTVDGITTDVLASNLDPGRGIDVRGSSTIYFVARSGFGGPSVVAARPSDAGAALEAWMPASEIPASRNFAVGATDDWSLVAGMIHRRVLGADASAPWQPAPNVTGLFADLASMPFAIIEVSDGDGGTTDFVAKLDDDAGVVELDASMPPIVATTSNTVLLAASDDAVFTLSLPAGTTTTLATTTDHVVDVAYDAGWAVWVTRGDGKNHAQVWRMAVK